jgi:hypothetical protein
MMMTDGNVHGTLNILLSVYNQLLCMPLATLLIMRPLQEVLDSKVGLETDYHDRKAFLLFLYIGRH